uniref:Cytochrome P450 n=1 Tax=Globisporangium ultimum (strain ATCC 200006 / CBS 805.95 / DAOM BR144) TaxID=431595 RepID=K3WVQ9_GLOUD
MDRVESPWMLLSAAVVGGVLAWSVLPDEKQRAIRHLPAPASTLPILGNTLDLAKYQSHRAHDWIAEQCQLHNGKPWRLQIIGSAPMLVLSSQEHFEDVLKTQFAIFDKGAEMKMVFDDAFGDSLIASDGDVWKYQRKKISHLFTRRSFRETITTSIHKYIRVLGKVLDEAAANPDVPLNFGEASHQMSFDIFSEVGFGLQTNSLERRENNLFVVGLGTLSETFEARFQQPNFWWRLKRFFQIGNEKKMKESVDMFHNMMDDLIYENIKMHNSPTYARSTKDVISLFMEDLDLESYATDPAKQQRDMKFLREVGFAIIGAGKDSTATSLMWCIIMLNRHSEVEAKIRDELHEKLPKLFTDKDYVPSLDDVSLLVYTEAALRETLRLCPIVPLNAKEANRDTTLSDGTFLKKGTRVYIPSYSLARNPNVWGPDAAEYKPDRWIEVDEATGKEKVVQVPDSKFNTFHGGPRVCPGMRFALFQLKAVLAYILSKYHLKTAKSPDEYTYAISAVLSVRGPLLVHVNESRAQSY